MAKNRDLINLLHRAVAVIENPASERAADKAELIKDLLYSAHLLEISVAAPPPEPPAPTPSRPSHGMLSRGLGTDIPPRRR